MQSDCITKVPKDGCPGIPTPIRMTPCPPPPMSQTLLQTLWRAKCLPKVIHTIPYQTSTPDFMDRGHLDRENDISESQVLTKCYWYHWDSCLEHSNSCQDDPLSSQTPTPDFMDRGHLDRENNILESEAPWRFLRVLPEDPWRTLEGSQRFLNIPEGSPPDKRQQNPRWQ